MTTSQDQQPEVRYHDRSHERRSADGRLIVSRAVKREAAKVYVKAAERIDEPVPGWVRDLANET
ncbi:hypothetical protein GCM10027055_01140 [Janibacter alkaliphilus]|uniref:Uncharacterized protein n=1 Tax=Janibacter alkaliphilus TaxID=1069963 RepID=A0A852X1I0_9MICO|nr:hypothetical protein [Janibacter alkaliphilus]NYG36729.1 hypothetical protein [Janibacter alkaliphilus]